MKFKKGNMVFFLPWSRPLSPMDRVMYIMEYDEKKQSYKCFEPSICEDDVGSIVYCKEEDMILAPKNTQHRNEREHWNHANQEWFNELCYPMYDYTNPQEIKTIREASHTYPTIQGWLRTQKPHSEGGEKKKFRKGKMVFYAPCLEGEGDKKVLYVINFDEETGKYKCFEPAISRQESRICYCLPEEIIPVPRGSALRKDPSLANLSKKKWFSEECHPIYYYHDGKEVFLREAWDTYENLQKIRKIKREWEKRREKEKR